jgi:hypothetical protein
VSRLLAELAVATNTSPLQWQAVLDEDPRLLVTVCDVMRERSERARGG